MAKVLIATYSWSGQTQRVADQLSQLLPAADTYQITVSAGTFSSDMFETDAIATKQVNAGEFPQLKGAVPDLTQYDLILVGSPVWHGRPATPVHTFLEQLKGFDGKVASFYTDAGNAGDYEQVFKQWAGDLTVLPAHRGANGLAQWLQQLK